MQAAVLELDDEAAVGGCELLYDLLLALRC